MQIHTLLMRDVPALAAALALDAGEARIEVQMLLQRVLGVSRAYLVAHAERMLIDAEYSQYQSLLQRRLRGEPMAYILGEREFFGLNLKVTPATLIPRPDTELLVELALQRLPASRENEALQVLDLGTGSGAIALAIAHERPQASVTAVDASPAALQVAAANARALGIRNVEWVLSNWFAQLGERKFALVVSNPPYINEDDPHLARGDVRFEPVSALVSGRDGLDDLRHLVQHAAAHLQPHGWLLLEHGYDQAARVRGLLQQAGYASVFSARDLAGNERVSGGQLPD